MNVNAVSICLIIIFGPFPHQLCHFCGFLCFLSLVFRFTAPRNSKRLKIKTVFCPSQKKKNQTKKQNKNPSETFLASSAKEWARHIGEMLAWDLRGVTLECVSHNVNQWSYTQLPGRLCSYFSLPFYNIHGQFRHKILPQKHDLCTQSLIDSDFSPPG